jgi:hypothetical protein
MREQRNDQAMAKAEVAQRLAQLKGGVHRIGADENQARRRSVVEIIRTPDERFENVPEFTFAPHYVEIDGVRVHYVDEGPQEAEPVLLLHGEPSWSYLYRTMIPIIASAGYRVVAPDLVGFGRSDKPTRREDYTYQRHVDWMRGVLEALDLQRTTLVGQDWGGLLGCAWQLSRRVVSPASSLRTRFCPQETSLLVRHFFAGNATPKKRPSFMLAALSKAHA